MGIKPKLLLEGDILDLILKLFRKGDAEVVGTIDDVANAMMSKGFNEDVIKMIRDLSEKEVLTGTEREALSNIIRYAFPEIVEKAIKNEEDFIITNYGNQALKEVQRLMANSKIPDSNVLSYIARYTEIKGLDDEFFKIWRDEYRKVKPVLPKSLEDATDFGKELEVGDASDFAKAIFTDLEGIELTSAESDLVNRAAKVVEEGIGKISKKEYVILISELEKIGLDLEKAIKEYDSKMKGLDKVKQMQWEGRKRKISSSMSKFWDSLNILKQNVSKLKPKSMSKFLLNTFKYIILPLTVFGAGVSLCESKNIILSTLCGIFKKGAKKAIVDPLTATEPSSDTTTTPVIPAPVNPAPAPSTEYSNDLTGFIKWATDKGYKNPQKSDDGDFEYQDNTGAWQEATYSNNTWN